MIVKKIADLIASEEDTVVVACKGVLIECWKPNPTEKGTLQNGTLKDETGQIGVVFSNKDDMRPMKGKTLYILAHKGERGWVGTKRKVDTYKNKNTPTIWVYEAATVTQDAPVDGEAPADTQPPAQRQQQAPASQGQRKEEAPPPSSEDAYKKARLTINRHANLMLLCLNAADYIAAQYEEKHTPEGGQPSPEFLMSHEDVRTLATTLFIQAARDGLDNAIPAGPLSIKPAAK